MKNRDDNTVTFKVKSWPAIYTTIGTWLPLMWVLVPVLYYGEISEKSLGPVTPGGRFDVSPQSFFMIMTLGTIIFFFISFLPVCLCFIRGYFVKFSEDIIFFKGKQFQIEEIDRIEPSALFSRNFKFVFKNGKSFFVSASLNGNISDYIRSRFSEKIIS